MQSNFIFEKILERFLVISGSKFELSREINCGIYRSLTINARHDKTKKKKPILKETAVTILTLIGEIA